MKKMLKMMIVLVVQAVKLEKNLNYFVNQKILSYLEKDILYFLDLLQTVIKII